MNFGEMTRARVISRGAAHPPIRCAPKPGQRSEIQLRQQLLHPRASGRRVAVDGFQDGEDVLLDVSPRKMEAPAAGTRYPSEPHIHRIVGHVVAVEHDAS